MKNKNQEQPAILDLDKIEKTEPVKKADVDRWIDDLVGSFCDPIIAYPSPWMDTIPEDLKKEVPLARMLLQMRYHAGQLKYMTATDVEALIYLYPASLEAPMGHDWSEIYIYLGAVVCGGMGRTVPDDLKDTKLSDYQLQELERLKRWIYEQRVKHRKARARGEKLEKKTQEQEEPEAEVVQHAFDLGR